MEIGLILSGLGTIESFKACQGLVHDGLHVFQRTLPRGESQFPSRVVRHFKRVVEFICVGNKRGLFVQVSGDPQLLEPAHMAYLPQWRVHDVHGGAEHLLSVKVHDKLQQPFPGVERIRSQLRCQAVGVLISSCHETYPLKCAY